MAYIFVLAAVSGRLALERAVVGAAVAGGLILLLAVISRGGIGGGDFKLMLVVGGALGWEAAMIVFALSQIVALVVALAVSIMQRRILRGWLPIGAIIAALAAVVLVTTPR